MVSNTLGSMSEATSKGSENCTMEMGHFRMKARLKTVFPMDRGRLTVRTVKLLRRIGFKASIRK